MLCPNCETQNDDNARLCIECGFPLSGAVSRGAGAKSPVKLDHPHKKSKRPAQPQDLTTIYAPASSASTSSSNNVQDYRPSYPNSNDFSWDSPYGETNPAKALFQPTESFQPIGKTNSVSRSSDPIGRIQQPQIVQVDLQGRVIEPDVTQQIPSISNTGEESFFSDEYDYAVAPTNDSYASDFDQDYTHILPDDLDASYGGFPSNDEHSQTLQDDFNSFYQDQTTLHVNTIEFDDEDRMAVQQPRHKKRTKTGNASEKRSSSQRNYRIPKKNQGLSGKQRILIIGGVTLVVAALVFVVGFAFGLWGGVPVPNVENMSQAEAVKILEENGFTTQIVQEKSDEIEGRVLSTEPRAGTFAEEGSEIIVNVAVARTIPDVVGESLDEALKMLEESGYTNIKTQIERNNGVEGIILSTTPTADTRAKSTMEITLVVSENYKVPDISNMSYEEAKSTIEAAGLVATVAYIDTEQYPDGTIIGSDPGAGTRVDKGATVTINIARKRGVELNALATELLASGNTIQVGGVNYQVESLTSLSYQGNDVVAFTIQARPYVEFFGETLFASATTAVSGSIQYNSSNEVVSIT